MNPVDKIERLIVRDGINFCWCSYEKMYKPCNDFSPRPGQHGFQYYCKDCAAAIKRDELEPEASIYVRQGADLLLSRIGYELNSELTIHQQFLKKHFIDD